MSKLHLGDCMDVMRDMPDNSVDAVITDPPYGLAFMGVAWDTFGDGRKGGARTDATFDQVGGNHHPTSAADQARTRKSENVKFQAAMTPIFAEALRVAKPGAHLLCFGGTRTFHRMTCAIEDAGWEIRDSILWVWSYGQGFPKSMDVGKAIDKALGAEREVVGKRPDNVISKRWREQEGRTDLPTSILDVTVPASDEAKQWDGWGTCLKPAWEPIIMARKPLDGTVAHNVLTWGVGALNIDACRVPIGCGDDVFAKNPHTRSKGKDSGIYGKYGAEDSDWSGEKGRFPANLVHDGSQMVLDLFPDTQRADGHKIRRSANHDNVYGGYTGEQPHGSMHTDKGGSAGRFFYCAKASKKDRGEGNDHPTVKPTALMEWLVRMVTREGAVVLDPFMGSGTTGIACANLGRGFVGIEREWRYMQIAGPRIAGREHETGMYEG